ncbi:MAG: arylamine N-acetyltransferase [Acidobacteria bacterium]|nr:MAG: arylamine N-acetyltransferase [Acidobacteriota bacterium]
MKGLLVQDVTPQHAMNLDTYLARVGYEGEAFADLATLRSLHRAHVTTIPFENLDIQLGLPIDLALDALERKMVVGHRGGYCFEHNSLFLAALTEFGFRVISCEARVSDGAAVTPRTHMLLVVSIEDRQWLCDVGFGGSTPLGPVPLDGSTVEQGGTRYRVEARDGFEVLQADAGEGWTDQYVFEVSPREPIDFVVANWYTSTHPESRFVKTLTAQLRTTSGCKVLRNLQWTERSAEGRVSREIRREELEGLLAVEFGLCFPPGTRFRAIDGQSRS